MYAGPLNLSAGLCSLCVVSWCFRVHGRRNICEDGWDWLFASRMHLYPSTTLLVHTCYGDDQLTGMTDQTSNNPLLISCQIAFSILYTTNIPWMDPSQFHPQYYTRKGRTWDMTHPGPSPSSGSVQHKPFVWLCVRGVWMQSYRCRPVGGWMEVTLLGICPGTEYSVFGVRL